MSLIWSRLTTLKSRIERSLENVDSVQETYEPGMDRFHNEQWTNRTWESPAFRRAHLDVVDARGTKGLWMMHLCIMPHLSSDGPIFGFDVIAGKNKITGAFLDYSPGVNSKSEMVEVFAKMAEDVKWSKERTLPDWAQQIFSPHMIAAGNIKDETEVEQIYTKALHSLWYYTDNIGYTNGRANDRTVALWQNRYAYYQKQNPHTPRTMKALGLPEDDVDDFIGKCLFPEIDMNTFRVQ